MKYRRRIYYNAEQRAEIWGRWQRGESMSSIGRVFDRQSSSVFSVISPTGGIRPPDRTRSKRALGLGEREEISRGLSTGRSLRSIAFQLGRAPSTISREVRRNGGRVSDFTYVATWQGFVYVAFVIDVFARRVVECPRHADHLGRSCSSLLKNIVCVWRV